MVMKKAERLHLQKVASDGCVVCRLFEGVDSGPCEIHHIRTGMGTTRANHFQVIGLCAAHHRTGGYGVAIHAARFFLLSFRNIKKKTLDFDKFV
jgi:hypothetical protein